ncbi:MAG TPA: carboxypeptidase-like regulatory domain-containing protein [Vicinamibacterales bacterium]|nr:carboxypeptidase-like regulatory domain-containing protein [Vicinamibacterales bacterium]
MRALVVGLVVAPSFLVLLGCTPARRAALNPSSNGFVNNLTGWVYDTANRFVDGANVEILTGPYAGMQTTTNADGGFSFSGRFVDLVTIRASRDGYRAQTQTLNLPVGSGAPGRYLSFILPSLVDPTIVVGDFALTLKVDPACTELPTGVRTRTYSIIASPMGSMTQAIAYVGGATMLDRFNRFIIAVSGDYVRFGFELIEQVADRTYLMIDGEAGTTVGSRTLNDLTTAFDGVVSYCVAKSELGSVFYAYCEPELNLVSRAECRSANHQVILTRQERVPQ